MDDITHTFLRATLRLEQSAADLDQTIGDTNAIQAKHDAAVKRIIDLVKSREKNWDAGARAALNSLSAKHAMHQRALDKQRDRLTRAREVYERHHQAFATLADRYGDRLVEFRTATRTRQQRESALSRIFERVLFDIAAARARQDGDTPRFKTPEGSHGYIALDIPRFLNMLIQLDGLLTTDPEYAVAAGRYRPVSFLEIGCGQGRNIVLARNSRLVLWESLSGFDINPDMVAAGQAQLGLDDALFVADAMTFDYGGHDVIYSFRPFSDLDMQSQLEARIADTMRDGAYLLAPTSYDLGLFPELRRMGDDIEIWKKTG